LIHPSNSHRMTEFVETNFRYIKGVTITNENETKWLGVQMVISFLVSSKHLVENCFSSTYKGIPLMLFVYAVKLTNIEENIPQR